MIYKEKVLVAFSEVSLKSGLRLSFTFLLPGCGCNGWYLGSHPGPWCDLGSGSCVWGTTAQQLPGSLTLGSRFSLRLSQEREVSCVSHYFSDLRYGQPKVNLAFTALRKRTYLRKTIHYLVMVAHCVLTLRKYLGQGVADFFC